MYGMGWFCLGAFKFYWSVGLVNGGVGSWGLCRFLVMGGFGVVVLVGWGFRLVLCVRGWFDGFILFSVVVGW